MNRRYFITRTAGPLAGPLLPVSAANADSKTVWGFVVGYDSADWLQTRLNHGIRHVMWALTLLLATSLTAVEPSAALMQRIMKAADKSNDGKLALEEYKPLDVQARHHGDEHFQAGDRNNDGFIDSTELAGALNKQTWFAILTEGIEASFSRLDANKDNKLDAPEYRRISKMGAHSMQHFEGADTNKDSFLDLTEFTAHAEEKLNRIEGGVTPRKPKK